MRSCGNPKYCAASTLRRSSEVGGRASPQIFCGRVLTGRTANFREPCEPIIRNEMARFIHWRGKMRKLKTIDFGAAVYKVDYVERLLSGEENEKLRGQINHPACLIQLEESLDPQDQFITTLHECFHYYLSQYGHSDAINPARLEGVINTLAVGMTAVLRKNPVLITMLQEL
jgi:hypothetical protein